MTGPRGRFWAWAASLLGICVLAAAVFVPVPYLARSPGPVFDLLGEQDGEQILEISGTDTYPTTGTMDMTTVSESGGTAGPLTVGAALVGWFAPETTVVLDENPETDEADRAMDVAVFDASQSAALAAAANYTGHPVTSRPLVASVRQGSPADGALRPGDLIDRVNGTRVRVSEDVGEIVSGEPPGTEFTFRVRGEDGAARTVRVVSAPGEEDPQRGVVGILVDTDYSSDFDLTLNVDGIGGPSAGLMLALATVDRLTPGDLVADRHLAGTGSISAAGEVGEIGGVDKKMISAREAGAELFLTPPANCAATVGVTPAGLAVAPVADLAAAVAVVEDWRAGRPLPTCPGVSDQAPTG